MIIYKRESVSYTAVWCFPEILVEVSETGKEGCFLNDYSTFINYGKPPMENKVLGPLSGHTVIYPPAEWLSFGLRFLAFSLSPSWQNTRI
jgi:hypothetical protein